MRLFSLKLIIFLSGLSLALCAQAPKTLGKRPNRETVAIRGLTPKEREFATEVEKIRDLATRSGQLEAALTDQKLVAIGSVKEDPFNRKWPDFLKKFGLDQFGMSHDKIPLPDYECMVIGTQKGFRAYKHIFHPNKALEALIQKQVDFIEDGMVTDFYAKRVLELTGIKNAHEFTVTVFVFATGEREVSTNFILGPCDWCDRSTVASAFIRNMRN